MFRYKSNKKAFIIAALIVLLCLVSLSGATLALFTGQTDDGAIGIVATAGYFNVDIIDTSPEGNSLVGEYLQFQTTKDQDEILFEPGATFHTQGFKVENDGDIPIQFRMSVSDSIKTDKDIKISIEEFNEYFEMWIATSTDFSDAERTTEFIRRLEANSVSKESYYLFVKMKENVNNDLQNKAYKGIGITVYAVQGNANVEE